MNMSGLQIKIKADDNMDGETADEANNLLRNGILVETSKGLICMSLNDALSSDLNLSVEDLRNVAARLISQQNVSGNKDRIIQTGINCDSDGFSSECSDISSISTTTSGSSVQSAFLTFSSLTNDIHTNIINCEGQIQSIINRPKIVSISNLAFEKTVNNVNGIATEKFDAPLVELGAADGEMTNKSVTTNIKTHSADELLNPIISKNIAEVTKPKKGRGGWPKGRKRKPELLNLPPKAPATGYNLYLNEQRKLFKDSKLAFHEITKIIGNRWSSLTLEEKKPYLEKAEEDKKRYREELKQYRQSDAYRAYLTKKRKKRLQNNVLSESDMDATDDFDEEDNEELYCRTCDQWFHNLHNKREHLQGKQHLQSVAGDINRELGSDIEGVGTTSTISFSTSLDESSLDGMPNLKSTTDDQANSSMCNVQDAMANLAAIVTKREREIKVLQNHLDESKSQQEALCSQLLQLSERHKKLQKDLLQLKENEKNMENRVFRLWQVPSWFIFTDFNTDSATDFNEGTEGLEAYRIAEDDPCDRCHLQRSNAMRRRGRRPFLKASTLKRVQSARKNFEKCIERCGLLETADFENKTTLSGILRRLGKFKMKQITMRRIESKAAKPEKGVPWIARWKSRKTDPVCSARIQQVDGGFFEKFGSLFREQAEYAATQEQIEKQRVAEAAAHVIPTKDEEESDDNETVPTVESDAEVSLSSDSEVEGEKEKTELIATAWNIDELYTEILYEILHNVGCDATYEVGQIALFSYAQDAFKISNDKHKYLMEVAVQKEAPELLLNVEVIEAKDLKPKDSNGLSDPFVTLYLASSNSHRYNTSVKNTTLNPVWEEHFALPVSDNVNDDSLCLEVWDFDPAESVKEKLGKIFEVKGVRGMRKLMKEIALTATTGQHENELIGRAKIPLNTVPASGMTMWYSLDKKNKVNRQGVLKIRVSYSSKKNSQVAEQEHRHLLRLILLHELEMSKVAPYWWCGTFSPHGEQLLTQHIAQSGLSPIEVALCQYCVFSGIHQNHPLSFTLFSNLLDKLVKPLQTNSVSEEDVKLFWDATKKLLPSCFSIIRKIRKKNTNEKTTMKQVTEVLKIFNYVNSLELLPNTDLFPASLYPWITYQGDEPNCDILETLNDAVAQGANDWLNHILENNKRPDETDLSKLQNLIQIIQLIRSDLQKAIEYYDKLFQETVNFPYAKALYVFYQAKVSTLCEPEVVTICKSLKKLNYAGYNSLTNGDSNVDPLTEGTSLFELYLAIQRFVMLGVGLCPADSDTFHIKNFHQWFHRGVAQWLDIAVYKALQRIEKAVELDKLVPVDNTVKYSSSAVDTLTIFYQIKVFWDQLNWPNVEGSYTFIAKIIDDICRCCVFYADKMSAKVDGMGDVQDIYEKKFEVTNEWCLAINNIDYVRETLEPFTRDLGMDDVIQKICDLKSPVEAQRCQHTLENVIANAIDTVRNKIIELLEKVVWKMEPSMKRLLIEGAELCDQDSNIVHRLMMYVDNNLATLHRELNEENFNRILEIVWNMLSDTLGEIIQANLDKRRPPSFFDNLRKTLNLMLGSFKNPADCDNCNALKRTEQILRVNGLETTDLIHEVHLNMTEQFKQIKDSQYGEISVRAKFEGNTLTVEVMNARNLIAMDSNGSCDAFVRIHLLPEHKFSGMDKPKTKTHNKTQFPLYDEKFVLKLSTEQRELEGGLILFSVKDKDLLGYNNQYIGEAFIHFKDIEDTTQSISCLPQIHLQLSRPTESTMTSDGVKALEHRQGDKLAKEFLRRLKQRMGS